MIFQLCKWLFDRCINWHTLTLNKGGRTFYKLTQMQSISILSSFVHSRLFLAFLCFASFSTVLSCYFDILVNSMTIWSGLKLPRIAWPSSFKPRTYCLSHNSFIGHCLSHICFWLRPWFLRTSHYCIFWLVLVNVCLPNLPAKASEILLQKKTSLFN